MAPSSHMILFSKDNFDKIMRIELSPFNLSHQKFQDVLEEAKEFFGIYIVTPKDNVYNMIEKFSNKLVDYINTYASQNITWKKLV